MTYVAWFLMLAAIGDRPAVFVAEFNGEKACQIAVVNLKREAESVSMGNQRAYCFEAKGGRRQ